MRLSSVISGMKEGILFTDADDRIVDLRDVRMLQLAGQGGFVNDDQLPGGEGVPFGEVVLPPHRGVLGGDPEIVGEDLSGNR